MMYQLLGGLGAFILVMASVPQLIKSVVLKDVSGVSLYTLLCLCSGHGMMLVYILGTQGFSFSILDYSFNTLITLTNLILYFKYKKQ